MSEVEQNLTKVKSLILNVRIAEERDSTAIFEWRNDALTRQMSHTNDVVQWNAHRKWFAASLTNEQRLLLICEDGDTQTRICVVRFDVDRARALVSINLSPAIRGKGLSKLCLSSAIQFFKKAFPNVTFVDAEIKTTNKASQRSFESVGFAFLKQDGDVLHYQFAI